MDDNEFQIVYPGWEVVRKIGNGSYGRVYEIERDLYGKKEKAALKLISIPHDESDVEELQMGGYSEESITAHFKTYLADIVGEYSMMSELKGHTNIVCCDDVRQVQRNTGFGWDIYIRMELLKPLMKAIGPDISETEVVKLGTDLCTALTVCRRRSILHRDIKPQNIFVSRDGDYKLGDFGIAKIAEKTSGGTKIGTYNYMAPEVYNNKPYGYASDIYSLGMVLYWLLNDRRAPFMPAPPAVPSSSDMDRARERRFSGEPLPPPANGSEQLKQVVLKACAFDPEDRYQRAEELRSALLKTQEDQAAARTEPLPDGEKTLCDSPVSEENTVIVPVELPESDRSSSESRSAKPSPKPGRQKRKPPQNDSGPDPAPKPKPKLIRRISKAAVAILALFLVIIAVSFFGGGREVSGSKYDSGTTYVSLTDKELSREDIDQLAKLKKLSSITLTNCSLPSDYSAASMDRIFSRLTDLKTVNCSGRLELPAEAPQLKTLSLPAMKVGGLENVGLYPKLKRLDISSQDLEALPDLSGLADLTSLNCSYNTIPDSADAWSKLPAGENLTELRADGCGIGSDNSAGALSAITRLQNLTVLSLDNNNIRSAELLSGLSKLKTLSLNNNQIRDLAPLSSMIYLTELRLGGNGLSDLSPLSNCTRLEIVQLNDNEISEISVLEKSLDYIKGLYIAGNYIDDLSPLEGASALEYLDADNNLLNDLSCLKKLSTLKELSAASNQVTAMFCAELPLLQHLDLHGNPLTQLDCSKCPELEYLDVSDTLLSELSLPAFENYGVSLLASNTPLETLQFSSGGKTDFDIILLDGDPALFSSGADAALAVAVGKCLAFSYDSAWGRTTNMTEWRFRKYMVLSPSLDAVRDLEDALGADKVIVTEDAQELYAEVERDSAWTLTSTQTAPDEVTERTRAVKTAAEEVPSAEDVPSEDTPSEDAPSADAPSADMLKTMSAGDSEHITYPKSTSYLPALEIMYAAPEKAQLNLYWAPIGDNTHQRSHYVYSGDMVTVLARENGFSCIVYTTETGNTFCGWVSTRLLSYTAPEE